MESNIKVDYIITTDGKYVGWAKDYEGVVVEANDLVELRTEIMISLKVMLQYLIDKIDDDTMSVHCNKHHDSALTQFKESIDEVRHVCGLQGFEDLGDTCPACDELNEKIRKYECD
jgi:hypothetical protein